VFGSLAVALARAGSASHGDAAWGGRPEDRWRRVPRRPAWAVPRPAPSDVPGFRSAKLARVEAALFVADEPLTAKRIAEIANLVEAAEARALVGELQTFYQADGSGFSIESIAGGWQLRSRREFAPWLARLHPDRQDVRLSHPALETLAVVAYRQPVLRSDIETIRGVACGEMLRHLIERGLVRICGHHDSLGRPLLYGTTRRFLELFGLAGLHDLPMAEQLRVQAPKTEDGAGKPHPPGEPSAIDLLT
jgi:segregation and condensation protein B